MGISDLSNETISSLPTQTATDYTNLYLPGIDLTKPVGSQNRKISANGLLNAYYASNQSGGGQYTQHQFGITAASGGHTDTILYQPVNSNVDIVLNYVEIAQAVIAVVPYYFQIYAGDPNGTGLLVYDSFASTGINQINTYTTYLTSTLYIPAVQGNTTLYLRLINTGSATVTYSYQASAIEFQGNGVVLPQYVTPPPYLGPLLSTVHVGASEQFAEPRYGLQALANGGTMYIDDGEYYLPIGFANPNSNISDTIPNYGGTSAHDCNRFTSATIIGTSAYGTILNGRGGYGKNGLYRLTQGKGFVWSSCQLNISHIHFINGGGADSVGDGEAGLYIDNGPTSATTHNVSFCAFDGNENGIFVPPGSGGNGNSSFNTINITSCDFSLVTPNGQSGDGLSHNFYIDGIQTNVTTSNFFGCLGNSSKNRGPAVTFTNCYIESGGGRAIDIPAAGNLIMNGGTLCSPQGANAPFLAYGSETITNTVTNPQFNNVTVLNERQNATIWPATPGTVYNFNSCTQNFVLPGSVNFTRYNSQGNSDPSCCTGLVNSYDGSVPNGTTGGNLLANPPAKPGSVAQPGYVKP